MQLEVRRTIAADHDLHGIWSFIRSDNQRAADTLLKRLTKIFDQLGTSPEMGRARPELGDGLRSFPHGRYLIVYRATRTTLMVVRVLSSYRDLAAQTFPDR